MKLNNIIHYKSRRVNETKVPCKVAVCSAGITAKEKHIYSFLPLNFRVRNVTLQMPGSRQSQSLSLQRLRRANETNSNTSGFSAQTPSLSPFVALTQSLYLAPSLSSTL